MKRKMNGKLRLSKETLRTLAGRELGGIQGAGTRYCTTQTSNPTVTCESCFATCYESCFTCATACAGC